MEERKTSSSNATIISFLICEILAFVGFSLGNSFLLFGLLGVATFALILIFMGKEIKTKGISNYALFLLPLIIFGCLVAISPFSDNFDMITKLLVPSSFVAFSGIGYCSSQFKDFKISTAFIVIYGSIALLTLISYFYTMIQYVPFYTLIYKNSYIYFDGAPAIAPIGKTAYFLMGLNFMEVSVDYFSLFPSLLATSVIALFFINPKKEKKIFSIYSVFAGLGLICLITMPTKFTLLTDALLILIVACILIFGKFNKKVGLLKYLLYGFLTVMVLAFIVLVLNAQKDIAFLSPLQNIIASNPLLNRLYNANGLVARYNEVLDGMFSGAKLFGYNPYVFIEHGLSANVSNSWLFDTIMFSGLFGFIAFIVFVVFVILTFIKYFKKSNEQLVYKSLLVAFVSMFFAYSILNYDSQPYINYSNYIPFYMSGPFLISVFLIGLTFKDAYGTKVSEPVEEVKEDSGLVFEEITEAPMEEIEL